MVDGIGSIQIGLQPYMFHDTRALMFAVVDSHSQGYALQMWRRCCVESDGAVLPSETRDEAMEQEVLDWETV